MSSTVSIEGSLQKRAIRTGRSWKRRYFVLQGTRLRPRRHPRVLTHTPPACARPPLADGVLWYAKSEAEKATPRGEFGLTGTTQVVLSNAREFAFEVITPDVVVCVAAESEAEQEKWIAALQKAVEQVRRAPAPLDTSHGEQVKESAGGEEKLSLLKRLIPGRSRRGSAGSVEANEGGLVSFSAGGTAFEVDARYSFIRSIGHGAYGVVVSASDSRDKEKVAIKKVSKAFEDLVDAKRILREIKLLRHFDHENVIHIKDLGVPNPELGLQGFTDIYIVSELMETDLHRVIYSRQTLSDEHIQYFIYQIMRSLKYIHSADVVHRDLKPSNLLLNSTCDLKICDFGLARGMHDVQLQLTEYVVTRWYRAPEIMLACRVYTKAIDVWSVGCIFAELLGRKPLFPGEDYIHQLKLIAEVVGTPAEKDLAFVTSEKALKFMRQLPLKPKADWGKLYPKASPESLDLLDKMLRFDPTHRISVTDALEHPYLASLHHPEDEPSCPSTFTMKDDGGFACPERVCLRSPARSSR
jgi:serine/threonine protein kinase